MSPVMKKTTTLTLGAAAILASVAGRAQAQTPPVPLVPPAPIVQPAPMPAPMPMPRILSVPEISVTLPPIAIDLADLPALAPQASVMAAQALVDSRLLRESTRDAMERAREVLDRTRLDFDFDFDFQQKYSYDFKSSGNDYNAGKDLMYRRQYEQAITRFDKVIAQKGQNVDGALYWKAYAQYKLGRSDDSLATISLLRKDHPQSAYLQDAKALETDARRIAGKPVNPADVDDDELKALAIQGLMRTDPDRAVAAAESLLRATNSLRVKRQALYVLAQSSQPQAYQTLLNYAKGGGNPDLQLEAISYLAANRNKQQTSSADLMAIYQSTQSTDVKMAIVGALRASGNQVALTQIVSSGNAPVALRTSALNGLTGILSPQDLWTLYEKETNKDLKMQMVSAFASMQAIDQLTRIIKTEKDPEIRRRALRSLGSMKTEKTGQMLVDLYGSEQDVESKKSIISSLGSQNNAEGLVAIARKESSLPLKTEIVRRLSEMAPRNKVAADYLMEIIK